MDANGNRLCVAAAKPEWFCKDGHQGTEAGCEAHGRGRSARQRPRGPEVPSATLSYHH